MLRKAALIALLLALTLPALAQDAFERGLKAWQNAIDRPPLSKRLGGMNALARSRDVRAIPVIAARYAKPRVPKDHERYLLARVTGEHFRRPEHVAPLTKFLKRHRHDADGWLWFQGLHAAARLDDVAPILELVGNDREPPFVRAGALETLADERRAEILDLVPALLGGKLPKKERARALLAGSAAAGLRALADRRGEESFTRAAKTLVGLLDRKEIPDHAKLAVARHLAATFGSRKVTLDPAWWIGIIDRAPSKDPSETKSVALPRFMGLEATGRRVVYLIDLSDSMLDPLSYAETTRARRVPFDGSREFPWGIVSNRFEFAREHLRRSLKALPSDVRFAIIGFGDEAEPFRSTKALVPASKGNVAKAIRELDRIEAKPDTTGKKRPHGVLRGTTNLHGALRKAFQLTSRGLVNENEHVAEATFRDGADTIFLLSDGKPTKDDFAANDMAVGGRTITDPETGASRPDNTRRTGSFFGPYRNPDHLVADVHRMNLFRKAEIHTISMGDADLFLMHRIAMLGLGRYRNLGGNGVLALNGSSALSFALPEKPEKFTLECWVNAPPPRRPMALVADTEGAGFGLFLRDKDKAKPYAAVRVGKVDLKVYAEDGWKWKRWNHLAMTWDGTILRLFVNGTPAGEQSGEGFVPSERVLMVGAEPAKDDRPRQFARGAVDEVRLTNAVVYEKKFTPRTTLPGDAGTLLLLKFDGDGATPFSDASPHRHPAEVHGKPRVRGQAR
ncbi:MAG: LamG-like jellyroll fold domain-containing protein [Planctomycetota bacterium]